MWNNLYYDKNKNLWIKEGDSHFRNVGLSIKKSWKTSLDGKLETHIKRFLCVLAKSLLQKLMGKGRIPLRKSLQNFMFAKIAPSRLLRVTMYEEKYYGRVVPRSQADSFGKRYQSYGSDRGYDHSRYKP